MQSQDTELEGATGTPHSENQGYHPQGVGDEDLEGDSIRNSRVNAQNPQVEPSTVSYSPNPYLNPTPKPSGIGGVGMGHTTTVQG